MDACYVVRFYDEDNNEIDMWEWEYDDSNIEDNVDAFDIFCDILEEANNQNIGYYCFAIEDSNGETVASYVGDDWEYC